MTVDESTPAPGHQRARGRAELTLAAAPRGARISHLYQAAPLRILFPDPEDGDPLLAAMVNSAGGLAGGDRLELELQLRTGATATFTTPGAEKVYRSLGPPTEVSAGVSLEDGATFEWLPQETILFDGARLSRRMAVSMTRDARLLAAEMLVLGRAARGERLAEGAVSDQWRVRRDGRLIWADGLRLAEPAGVAAGRRFALGDAGALATLLLVAPNAAALLEPARDLSAGGASLVAPGLLLARWLGEASHVRRAVASAVASMRALAFGLPGRVPRLWPT